MTPVLTAEPRGHVVPMDEINHRDSDEVFNGVMDGKVTGGKVSPDSFTLTSSRTRKKGQLPPPCFRVETTDSGFRVRLDYYDEAGVRHRPYCCYLSADEWASFKGMTFEEAVPRIADRIASRRPKSEAEEQKVTAISQTIQTLTRERDD